MKTLILAAIRCSLMFTAVAALSIVYPASVQAVPTTYQYTGNHFTTYVLPYTASDFVTAMVTLAAPLPPNMPFTLITPTAFTFSDGVQTITQSTPGVNLVIGFTTGPAGAITSWSVNAEAHVTGRIDTVDIPDVVFDRGTLTVGGDGENFGTPGAWSIVGAVPETGSTLSLMTLTLIALGVAARQFKRGAA